MLGQELLEQREHFVADRGTLVGVEQGAQLRCETVLLSTDSMMSMSASTRLIARCSSMDSWVVRDGLPRREQIRSDTRGQTRHVQRCAKISGGRALGLRIVDDGADTSFSAVDETRIARLVDAQPGLPCLPE